MKCLEFRNLTAAAFILLEWGCLPQCTNRRCIFMYVAAQASTLYLPWVRKCLSLWLRHGQNCAEYGDCGAFPLNQGWEPTMGDLWLEVVLGAAGFLWQPRAGESYACRTTYEQFFYFLMFQLVISWFILFDLPWTQVLRALHWSCI